MLISYVKLCYGCALQACTVLAYLQHRGCAVVRLSPVIEVVGVTSIPPLLVTPTASTTGYSNYFKAPVTCIRVVSSKLIYTLFTVYSLIEAISGCQSWKLFLGSLNKIVCNTRLRVLLPSLLRSPVYWYLSLILIELWWTYWAHPVIGVLFFFLQTPAKIFTWPRRVDRIGWDVGRKVAKKLPLLYLVFT